MLHALPPRLDGVVLCELVDEVATCEAAYRQHQQPHEDQPDREGAELQAASSPRKPDREGRDGQRDEPHPVGDRAQDLRDRLSGLELALLDDRDPSRGLRNLSASRPITTTSLPISSISGRRSSTTVPPSTWMNSVSSSRSLTS